MVNSPELFHRMEYVPPMHSERILVIIGDCEIPKLSPTCAIICIGIEYSRYMSYVVNYTGASQITKIISEPNYAQCLLVAMNVNEFFTHPADSHIKINNILKFLRTTVMPIEYWGKRINADETYALTCNAFYDAHHLMLCVCHYGKRPVKYDTFRSINEIRTAHYTYNPASCEPIPRNQITHTLMEIIKDGFRHNDEIDICMHCNQSNSGYNMYRPFVSLMLAYESASPTQNTFIAYEMYRCPILRKAVYSKLRSSISMLKKVIEVNDILVFREMTALDKWNNITSTQKEYLYTLKENKYYIDGIGEVDLNSTDPIIRAFKLQLNLM